MGSMAIAIGITYSVMQSQALSQHDPIRQSCSSKILRSLLMMEYPEVLEDWRDQRQGQVIAAVTLHASEQRMPVRERVARGRL